MSRRAGAWLAVLALPLLFSTACRQPPAAEPGTKPLLRVELENKVRGGWAGQMIGVAFGAPTEFSSQGRIIEGPLPAWRPEKVSNAIDQDDLYVEMTFAEVMDRKGLDATSADFGDAFRTSRYNLWHANAAARRLLQTGVVPPDSGRPQYNVHANDIDFQIESDFIGLMTPGLPRTARDFCERVGSVMSSGDGLYGGVFITSMYSAAFFETDPVRVVQAGLAALPRVSGYAAVIRDVLAWHKANPDDWRQAWRRILDTWDRNDACPDGALRPFNIDARLNGAYVALGLLYGKGDFGRTIEVATRAGQDSDCNPSNAAGILGVMIGYDRIPDEWKRGIPAIASRRFRFTDYSFNDIVMSTTRRAEAVIERAGGRVEGDALVVPEQTAVPPALEQWNMGVADRIIPADDPAWQWRGAWQLFPSPRDKTMKPGRTTRAARASATLTFTGTALTIVGEFSERGGGASMTLDGERVRPMDTWTPPRTADTGLWHIYGLRPGRHVLKIETTGTSRSGDRDAEVSILAAVIFR
jgi:ADP-ribosylglycohydrolase